MHFFNTLDSLVLDENEQYLQKSVSKSIAKWFRMNDIGEQDVTGKEVVPHCVLKIQQEKDVKQFHFTFTCFFEYAKRILTKRVENINEKK